MPDPHCIAWVRALARVTVRRKNPRGLATSGQLSASAHHPCRIRWAGHKIICDRDLNIEVTRPGFEPEVGFYVNGLKVACLVLGNHVATKDFARLKC